MATDYQQIADENVRKYLRKNPGELNRLQRLMATKRAKEAVIEQQSENADSPDENIRRVPQDRSDDKLGYDIESAEAGGAKRFIEVKSVSGDWDTLGVGMAAPEFQKAQELGEQYWLYVVERAEKDAEIHRIQRPAHFVNQFFYDEGWKGLSEIQSKAS